MLGISFSSSCKFLSSTLSGTTQFLSSYILSYSILTPPIYQQTVTIFLWSILAYLLFSIIFSLFAACTSFLRQLHKTYTSLLGECCESGSRWQHFRCVYQYCFNSVASLNNFSPVSYSIHLYHYDFPSNIILP